jgi:hypothetical protein
MATYEELIHKKEAPKVQQLLRQTKLLHQMPHENVQGNMAAEMACQEVQETQEHLGATSQQNQHLQVQLSLLVLSRKEDEVDKRMKRFLSPV